MKLINAGGQFRRDLTYPADGSIASASLPQLVLPEHPSRSALFFQNTSGVPMYYRFGGAVASCTLNGTAIDASITVVNAGFNYTRAPKVHFYGGGTVQQFGVIPANTSYVGAPGPVFPAATRQAHGRALLTGGAVSSIVVDDAGTGYVAAPMVFLENDVLDPNGAFDPSAGGGSGFSLQPGDSIYLAHSAVTTDALAVFCGTINATFACWWMP